MKTWSFFVLIIIFAGDTTKASNFVTWNEVELLNKRIQSENGLEEYEAFLSVNASENSIYSLVRAQKIFRNWFLSDHERAVEASHISFSNMEAAEPIGAKIRDILGFSHETGFNIQVYLSDHPRAAQKIAGYIEELTNDQDERSPLLLKRLLRTIVIEAAIYRHYPEATELLLKYDIRDPRFLATYAKGAKIDPRSARDYVMDRNGNPVLRGKGASTSIWMQYFL